MKYQISKFFTVRALLVPPCVLLSNLSCTASVDLYAAPAAVGAGDCSSEANAGTLATCIGLAAANDTISVLPGTHVAHSLVISTALQVVGAGPSVSIVDGGGAGRLFTVDAPAEAVSFAHLSLQNGAVAGPGGAVLAEAGTVSFLNTHITANSASDGGGISCDGCTELYVLSSRLDANTATRNGGAIDTDSDATIVNSTISRNTAAGDGGGIHKQREGLLISGSELAQNSAGRDGGGVYSGTNDTEVRESALIDNEALLNGGALSAHGSAGQLNPLSIVNSTISGNTAARGGALELGGNNNQAWLGNLTLVDNLARNAGGADDIESSAVLVSTLSNSIITHPNRGGATSCTSGGVPLTLNGSGNLLDASAGCSGPAVVFNLGPLAPGSLGPLALHGGRLTRSYSLVPPSNAVDNPAIGICLHPFTAVPLGVDQRLSPRPVGAACDVGAYEWP